MLKHRLLKSLIAASVMIGPATQAMTLEKAEGTLKVQRAFSMHTSARKYSNNRSSIFFPAGLHRVKLEIEATAADGSHRPFYLGDDHDRGRVFEFTVLRDGGEGDNRVRILAPEIVDSISWQSSGQTFNMQISRSSVDRREPNRVIEQECQVKVSCDQGGWRSYGCQYAYGRQRVLAYDNVTDYTTKILMTDRASNQVVGEFTGKSQYRETKVVREIGDCKLHLK